MRPAGDPEVLATAARLARGAGRIDWPEGLDPLGACVALLWIPPVEALYAVAPDDECENHDDVLNHAARVFIDTGERGGPDEGWQISPDGDYWLTRVSRASDAARDPHATIPVSELPPLD